MESGRLNGGFAASVIYLVGWQPWQLLAPSSSIAIAVGFQATGAASVPKTDVFALPKVRLARTRDMAIVTKHIIGDMHWLVPGALCRDPVGGAVVLVLASPASPGVLRCNGAPMVPSGPLPCSYRSDSWKGTYLRPGRRYGDIVSGLEVRCLRGGHGYLTFGHRVLADV